MRMIKLLVCALAVALLAACASGQASEYSLDEWIDALTRMDYEAMWALTDPAVDIDKDGFIEKYQKIFSGLGVEQIAVEDVQGPDENGCFTYTATYKTKDYGDFTNSFSLQMISRKEGARVFWNYSLIFPEMDAGSTVQIKTEKAERGEIFTADGTLLARNTYAETLYMDVSKIKDFVALAKTVCPLTGLSQTKLAKMLDTAHKKNQNIVKLGAFFKGELTDEQKQAVESVEGLGIDDQMYTPIRDYPLGESAAHIVGYMGFLTGDDIPEGYTESDRIGVAGLEKAFETQLRGKDGKIVFIKDKWGKNVRTLWEDPAEQGQDLHLTIKSDLQQKAYNALKNNLSLEENQSGVAIVMDASTGYVEAMSQFPSYDDNWFTFGLSKENSDYISSNARPLYSLAMQGLYPPGSVIKPFTATAALEEGVITPDSEFDGTIKDNKWQPDDMNVSVTRINDNAGWPLKLANALRSSDNIYFAWTALHLGADKLRAYFERVGFNQNVTFDLPVKTSSDMNTGAMMTDQLLADMGYGQGQLLVTPLQMAAMYTAFANKTGNIMQPMLVKSLCRTEGTDYVTVSSAEPTVWVQNAVSQSSLDTLTPMLKDVIDNGTGHAAALPGVPMAGKTGTAEIGNDKAREISWFACYWMDGYYNRLVLVMVDVAAEKGPVKFQIAHDLLMP